ncbi:MAG: hypothetical protein M3O91_09305 [Chloroflexota bacterium]|nr:hypothetical protein [Chloroflexota bacterium]
MSEEELDVPAWFWETEPMPVRFRLHRFEEHLRQHTIQLEKTLVGIGHPPTEAERLVRLVHNALGEMEALSLGAPEVDIGALERTANAIGEFAKRVKEAAA